MVKCRCLLANKKRRDLYDFVSYGYYVSKLFMHFNQLPPALASLDTHHREVTNQFKGVVNFPQYCAESVPLLNCRRVSNKTSYPQYPTSTPFADEVFSESFFQVVKYKRVLATTANPERFLFLQTALSIYVFDVFI